MFVLTVMDQEGETEYYGPFNVARRAEEYAEEYQKRKKEEMHRFEVKRLLPPVRF